MNRRPPTDRAATAEWSGEGPPRSRRHGDVYFSSADGLGEAGAVFLAGCGLPERWRGRRRFCVGELGFGTGLNIAALLQLWSQKKPPGAWLHIFSIEREPLQRFEAARALQAWPELGPIGQLMLDQWPGSARGFHHMNLPTLSASIDVAVMEAAEGLRRWNGRADAWFLDGFSPALDPEIWRSEVLGLVAERSAPDACAATYTVAAAVRDGLANAGFAVQRRPGFGRKRERLEAQLPGKAVPTARSAPRVAVIGAGVAGAALSYALRALGSEVTVFDASGPGAGASGGPAALSMARLDAGLGPIAEMFAQAERYATRRYDAAPGAVLGVGALQLAVSPGDERRFAKIAGSDLFEVLEPLAASEASRQLGEPSPAGLHLPGARIVDPRVILPAWLGEISRAEVGAIEPGARGWRLLATRGENLGQFDAVALCAGAGCERLWPGLPLTPVRGQVSVAGGVDLPLALSFGAYSLPASGDVVYGATHIRGEQGAELRAADDAHNLSMVAQTLPGLAARLAQAPRRSWAAVRAATPDYLPLAGAIDGAPGLFILSGLGSRGFVLAPLLGAHLAAQITGAPSLLPTDLARLVTPERFALRASRRGLPIARASKPGG